MDPKKIEVVMDWSTPNNLKDVRYFIGLTGLVQGILGPVQTIKDRQLEDP